MRLAKGYDCPGLTKKEWLRWLNRFGRNPDICPSCHGHAQAWYEKHSGIIPSKEPHRFVGNFELHENAWQKLGCPRPVIIQGDSRRLCEVVEKADCIVSSPPFLETGVGGTDNVVNKNKQCVSKGRPKWEGRGQTARGLEYGQTPGQLGSMKPGQVDCTISSPPFSVRQPPSQIDIGNNLSKTKADTYGYSAGQLGKMKIGKINLEGAEALNVAPQNVNEIPEGELQTNTEESTFWDAAKQIVQQCHQILKPGGVAIWVVKAFVRKGAIVDFPGDWKRLCESVGFVTLCEHHAMLVKETKEQSLFGDTIKIKKERKSFFRRLAESKGSPPINFENVICMSKAIEKG